VTLLTVLGLWFAAGLVATLVLGPRLRRAAEEAGPVLEAEPVYGADRSPLRWRLGTLGVVGLLAGSTGMAAAGALPGSTQTIAHHVLGTVGVHVPKAAHAPAEVATGPASTPWSDDVGPATSSPDDRTEATGPDGTTETAPPTSVEGGDTEVTAPDTEAGVDEPSSDPELTEPSETEPAEVDGTEPTEPPVDEPPAEEPPAEEPPPTTTTTTPPGEDLPPTTTTTTTPPSEEPPPTTTTTTLPAPPPPDPAG
jgi:hypothetical protein